MSRVKEISKEIKLKTEIKSEKDNRKTIFER